MPFVDGSGGGDAFAAGYICGMLRDEDEAGCLRIASALGASCVRAVGTTTSVFRRGESEEFLSRNELSIERI
jgi:sugar/nucleoside kinase (ribokinase family)